MRTKRRAWCACALLLAAAGAGILARALSLTETDLEKLEPGERVTIEQMLDDKNRPGSIIRIERAPAAAPAAA
ncbi:MAG: hypothetical protein GAK35_01900 [Herbaspirillum frisingense]|uniref:SAF domain-containing protein n=1 Tax=Herbaspirillum frisingense TaxID=92645 RepID=A0A7V8FX92_9BURK|nr:MAG: hypothetical protein GAK35_01900 [Herbaspirillum frisingense]